MRKGRPLFGLWAKRQSDPDFGFAPGFLMTNHYHLVVETPEANLSMGMGWMQNAYTTRINVRHGLWGHMFGGR